MTAQASDWVPITGAVALKNFMRERILANGEISRGEYFLDGSGILYSWLGKNSQGESTGDWLVEVRYIRF